jgi:hypothetical protein
MDNGGGIIKIFAIFEYLIIFVPNNESYEKDNYEKYDKNQYFSSYQSALPTPAPRAKYSQ